LYIQPEISGPAALLPTATLGKRTVWADALPAKSSRRAIAIVRIMRHSRHKSGEAPTMIKTIGLLTRKDGWTHEQFMKHWVEIHAPLAHAVPGLRRYVQNHIKGERTRADIPATIVEIDGIAELWFDDQATFEAAARSPEMKALHDDGAKFIGRIRSYIIEEKTVIG
jgi:uncharacterized protein (TIGR02118 family)